MDSKKVAHIRIQGPDRKGIISAITGFLSQNKCNIEDIDQRILDNYLVMNMKVDFSEPPLPLSDFLKNLQKEALKVKTKSEFRILGEKKKKSMAILVTREAHCLLDLINQTQNGQIKAEIKVIVGNQPELKPLAEKNSIPFYFVSSKNKKKHETRVLKILEKYKADLVVLARYMQILSPEFVFRHEGKIINIHPSLLPAFPGPRSYHQAFNKGVEIVGVTAHFATTDLDEGPIIAQDCFRVNKTGDTVESYIRRGQNLEAKVLSRAVKLFCNDRLCLRRGKVIDSAKLKKLDEQTQCFYR